MDLSLRLPHRLNDLAGHRADIGAAVTTNLGFIAHAAERDAHELASRGPGDRLAERSLADAGRSDQAQDRPGQLVGARLHREILDDPVLDLLKAIVVVVEHVLGGNEVFLDLRLLAPRDRQQPVQVVAHNGRFRRHRRHLPQLLQFVLGLLARFLGELGLGDLLLEVGELRRDLPRRRAPSGSPSSAR